MSAAARLQDRLALHHRCSRRTHHQCPSWLLPRTSQVRTLRPPAALFVTVTRSFHSSAEMLAPAAWAWGVSVGDGGVACQPDGDRLFGGHTARAPRRTAAAGAPPQPVPPLRRAAARSAAAGLPTARQDPAHARRSRRRSPRRRRSILPHLRHLPLSPEASPHSPLRPPLERPRRLRSCKHTCPSAQVNMDASESDTPRATGKRHTEHLQGKRYGERPQLDSLMHSPRKVAMWRAPFS